MEDNIALGALLKRFVGPQEKPNWNGEQQEQPQAPQQGVPSFPEFLQMFLQSRGIAGPQQGEMRPPDGYADENGVLHPYIPEQQVEEQMPGPQIGQVIPQGYAMAEDGSVVPNSFYQGQEELLPSILKGRPVEQPEYSQLPPKENWLKPFGAYDNLPPMAEGEQPVYGKNYSDNYKMYLREGGVKDSTGNRLKFDLDLGPQERLPTRRA